MESLKISLVAYGFTIVFAMLIALAIAGLGKVIKRLKLDSQDEVGDLDVPGASAANEHEFIAIAIAIAHARQNQFPTSRSLSQQPASASAHEKN